MAYSHVFLLLLVSAVNTFTRSAAARCKCRNYYDLLNPTLYPNGEYGTSEELQKDLQKSKSQYYKYRKGQIGEPFNPDMYPPGRIPERLHQLLYPNGQYGTLAELEKYLQKYKNEYYKHRQEQFPRPFNRFGYPSGPSPEQPNQPLYPYGQYGTLEELQKYLQNYKSKYYNHRREQFSEPINPFVYPPGTYPEQPEQPLYPNGRYGTLEELEKYLQRYKSKYHNHRREQFSEPNNPFVYTPGPYPEQPDQPLYPNGRYGRLEELEKYLQKYKSKYYNHKREQFSDPFNPFVYPPGPYPEQPEQPLNPNGQYATFEDLDRYLQKYKRENYKHRQEQFPRPFNRFGYPSGPSPEQPNQPLYPYGQYGTLEELQKYLQNYKSKYYNHRREQFSEPINPFVYPPGTYPEQPEQALYPNGRYETLEELEKYLQRYKSKYHNHRWEQFSEPNNPFVYTPGPYPEQPDQPLYPNGRYGNLEELEKYLQKDKNKYNNHRRELFSESINPFVYPPGPYPEQPDQPLYSNGQYGRLEELEKYLQKYKSKYYNHRREQFSEPINRFVYPPGPYPEQPDQPLYPNGQYGTFEEVEKDLQKYNSEVYNHRREQFPGPFNPIVYPAGPYPEQPDQPLYSNGRYGRLDELEKYLQKYKSKYYNHRREQFSDPFNPFVYPPSPYQEEPDQPLYPNGQYGTFEEVDKDLQKYKSEDYNHRGKQFPGPFNPIVYPPGPYPEQPDQPLYPNGRYGTFEKVEKDLQKYNSEVYNHRREQFPGPFNPIVYPAGPYPEQPEQPLNPNGQYATFEDLEKYLQKYKRENYKHRREQFPRPFNPIVYPAGPYPEQPDQPLYPDGRYGRLDELEKYLQKYKSKYYNHRREQFSDPFNPFVYPPGPYPEQPDQPLNPNGQYATFEDLDKYLQKYKSEYYKQRREQFAGPFNPFVYPSGPFPEQPHQPLYPNGQHGRLEGLERYLQKYKTEYYKHKREQFPGPFKPFAYPPDPFPEQPTKACGTSSVDDEVAENLDTSENSLRKLLYTHGLSDGTRQPNYKGPGQYNGWNFERSYGAGKSGPGQESTPFSIPFYPNGGNADVYRQYGTLGLSSKESERSNGPFISLFSPNGRYGEEASDDFQFPYNGNGLYNHPDRLRYLCDRYYGKHRPYRCINYGNPNQPVYVK